jgi:Beta-galactosidase
MWAIRPVSIAVALLIAAVPAAATGPDRPMGHVFDWGHELTQRRLPAWNPRTAPPIAPSEWYRTIDQILGRAGQNGLWFSGYNGLPFDIPHDPKDPVAWRSRSVFAREFVATGLSWDVNLEARAAINARALGFSPVTDPTQAAPTRRISLIDPGYERAANAEIRRLVPTYSKLPYVHAYTGSDEPIVVLPRGSAARTAAATVRRRQIASIYGWMPPRPGTAPTHSVREGLRWLAYSRYVSDRFFAMKARQAALIRRLDPDATVVPNDYVFLDGFMPWDYSRLATIADIVDADPYASLSERTTPGRGRYNHGFVAKFLTDLTGKPVRVIVEAFPYAGHTPTSDDLDAWTAQALRAGATHISFYALGNPRVTDPALYEHMLGLARALRDSRLPGRPVDARSLVLYATASEGQAQPHLRGPARYRTSGNALYTTYATLGELGHNAFVFDTDTRLAATPARLDAAHVIWLPRADTLERPLAKRLVRWVHDGGTLVITDPAAFRRTPAGRSLRDISRQLVGARLSPPGPAQSYSVTADAFGPSLPADTVTVAASSRISRSFATLPSDATVVGRCTNGAAAVISRPLGAGRVIAFATDPMVPAALLQSDGLVALVTALQRLGGGSVDDPAWRYTVPTVR